MGTGFSRTLSLLRKEKGVNQRIVASELGISQALLSHYETGAREPGLAFLVKACDYYGVSADFLLGRTMVRDASGTPGLHTETSEEKDNRLDGRSASALLGKKLIGNSVGLLYELAGRAGHNGLITEMTYYMGSAVYKLFRRFYKAAGDNPDAFFSEPAASFPYMTDADMACAEAKIEVMLSAKTGAPELPPISHEMLNREYPRYVQSLLTVVHQAGERARRRL